MREGLAKEMSSKVDNPSLQSKFRTFGSVAISDLPSNAAFNAQVKLVADRLDNMTASMDQTLQFLGQIEYMGHSHKPRGVGRQEFTVKINFDNLSRINKTNPFFY